VKGVPDLVDAVAQAPVALDVVGDGEERAEVEARVRRRGIADRVRLHGTLPPDRVAELLDAADLFVLNSRTPEAGDAEGLPVSVLEAMEASLPVVATRHGGIPEAVADGETGILVPERDTAALARALGALAGDAALRARMGGAGRRQVEGRYDLAECTRRLRELYA
jgi:colanic acid/amylovoran biosynthesis glycosyltransferase